MSRPLQRQLLPEKNTAIWVQIDPRSPKRNQGRFVATSVARLPVELVDLRAFKRQIGNQSLLAKHESDYRFCKSLGVVVTARAFRYHRHSRVRTNRPPLAGYEFVEGRLCGEYDNFTSFGRSDRQPE